MAVLRVLAGVAAVLVTMGSVVPEVDIAEVAGRVAVERVVVVKVVVGTAWVIGEGV